MDAARILNFLNALQTNNNKAWFDANRKEYETVKSDFHAFTEQLINGVESFDKRVSGLSVADCTYRINRDIRFSKDKSPYKTHFGAFICPKGKKSGYGGYYFHIQADGDEYLNNNLLAIGSYCPSPAELDSIRTEIYDNPENFIKALKAAKGFSFDITEKLVKAPKGYPADFKYMDYLKYKAYCIDMPLEKEILFSENLLDYVLQKFKSGYKFNEIVNKAIEFSREEAIERQMSGY